MESAGAARSRRPPPFSRLRTGRAKGQTSARVPSSVLDFRLIAYVIGMTANNFKTKKKYGKSSGLYAEYAEARFILRLPEVLHCLRCQELAARIVQKSRSPSVSPAVPFFAFPCAAVPGNPRSLPGNRPRIPAISPVISPAAVTFGVHYTPMTIRTKPKNSF